MESFTPEQKVTENKMYKRIKRHLKPKDGKQHVFMMNSFNRWVDNHFWCEEQYTAQMDDFLSAMQDDGYEIIDVKFNSLMNRDIMGEVEAFHTLIIYK
ncbi:MAG: hypothetical protein K1W33_06740 [Clostridia bacterium]